MGYREKQNGSVSGYVVESDSGTGDGGVFVGLGRCDVVDVRMMLSFGCVCCLLFYKMFYFFKVKIKTYRSETKSEMRVQLSSGLGNPVSGRPQTSHKVLFWKMVMTLKCWNLL